MNARQEITERTITPATDIFETEDKYTISMEMPGITKENLDITMDDERLIVSGKTSETCQDGYNFSEFRACSFERTFQTGGEIDRNSIEARLEDGVLEINLSKSEEVKPKKITVN